MWSKRLPMRFSSGTELDRGKCESRSDEKTLRSNDVVGHHRGTGVVHKSWNGSRPQTNSVLGAAFP